MTEKIRFGRPDVKPSMPAHTKGVGQGNQPGNYEKQPGHLSNGRSTAARSTSPTSG